LSAGDVSEYRDGKDGGDVRDAGAAGEGATAGLECRNAQDIRVQNEGSAYRISGMHKSCTCCLLLMEARAYCQCTLCRPLKRVTSDLTECVVVTHGMELLMFEVSPKASSAKMDASDPQERY